MKWSPAGLGKAASTSCRNLSREGVRDPACVYEDPIVREVGQQTTTVGDSDRRVESDRLPDLVNVGFGNAVLLEDGGSQIGAFDLEASLT